MPIVYCVYYYYLWKWYSSPSMFCARYIFLFDWIRSLVGSGMIVFISTIADYSTIFHLDSRSPHRWITVHSLLFAGAMHSSSYVMCQSHKPTLQHTTTHAYNHFFSMSVYRRYLQCTIYHGLYSQMHAKTMQILSCHREHFRRSVQYSSAAYEDFQRRSSYKIILIRCTPSAIRNGNPTVAPFK